MSDNAETRDALVAVFAHHGWDGDDTDPHCICGLLFSDEHMADAVLAALPLVAGPEVRPDETLPNHSLTGWLEGDAHAALRRVERLCADVAADLRAAAAGTDERVQG